MKMTLSGVRFRRLFHDGVKSTERRQNRSCWCHNDTILIGQCDMRPALLASGMEAEWRRKRTVSVQRQISPAPAGEIPSAQTGGWRQGVLAQKCIWYRGCPRAMNAIMERPRILRISSRNEGPGSVLIAVTDAGTGLDPTKMDRIFDAFSTTKPEGMGMGLSICRSIIEAHGGRLWASPNLPHGSVFQFTMPVMTKKNRDILRPRTPARSRP
jgi:hypothetical protein